MVTVAIGNLWLPKLAPSLSLRIPEPVAQGHPTSDYPFSWAIYRWIPGRPHRDDLVHDERQAADLAQVISGLRDAGRPCGWCGGAG
jgi:aminoglycoside phosphotransferase (APT) family kinase protein